MLMLIITILCFGSALNFQSTENIFPVSLVNDPFYDPYVDKIVHLDRSALLAIPRMDDETFLHSLYVQSPVRTYRMIESTSNDKSDDQMIEQTQIDKQWETLVVSGPLSINYLGGLLVLSSHKDFGFARPTPEFIYQYIRYPNSFRATLTQLSGEMYDAFLTAHTSMDQIQMLTQQIPNNIRTTLKVITQASPRLIQSILPVSLTNIERIINDCVRLTNNSANRFGLVMNLLQEIIELTQNLIHGTII
ncbi:hypothetical protein I4U23_000176 [Adineta vaga]|nr:hypothetical protein I4U23_000176 [Adineta vaga]